MLKKCTPLWHEAHFEVKMYKAHGRTTFGSWDVEKVHAVVVRSTFPSHNVQNAPGSDDFWTFRCRFARPAQGLEHQIFRFAKMILRDRCSTSYDLASAFRGRRSTLGRWSGKIAKCIGTRPSALHSTFHFWRKSRRFASFNFVFDVVNLKNWGSLAE